MVSLNYVPSESTVRPQEVESANGRVYLRKGIAEEERDGVTYYAYQEAKLSKAEYEEYLAQEEWKESILTTVMQEVTAIHLAVDEL